MGSTQLKKRGSSLKHMTDKEQLFCHEYPKDWNGQRAVIAAGYSKKSAGAMAVKLLNKPHIKAYLGNLKRRVFEKVDLSVEEVLRHLCYLATRTATDFVDENGYLLPISEMNERAQACIDGFEQEVIEQEDDDGNVVSRLVKTKIKLSPKAAGVDMALKHKGLYAAVEEKLTHVLGIDWKQMANPPINHADIVEERIAAEESQSRVIEVTPDDHS
jgi:phage terminase small subunit